MTLRAARRFARRGIRVGTSLLGCLLVGVACAMSTPVWAADFYWDTNGATANGDGGANFQNGTGSRMTTSSSGTTATFIYNSSTSANYTKSVQFGFGTTASGNLTNGGTVTIAPSGGGTLQIATMVINASGSVPYTFQNAVISGGTATLQLNTGGADVPAGYGIIVNSNVSGDTTFSTAAGGTFRVSLNANQSWQNNSTSSALLMNVPVIGAFSLTTNGAGTTVFGGANTFSGGLTVGAGTLRATNASALGAGTVTVSSSATLDIRAAITKDIANSGTVSIGAGGSLTAGSLGGALTLGGVSGTAVFTSTQSGTLSLGSLAATGNTAIGLAAGSRIAASGAIDFTGSDNLITLTGTAGRNGSYTLVQGSTLTNSSGLSLTGGAIGGATIGLGGSTVSGRTTYQFATTANALLLTATTPIANLVWDGSISSGTWNDTAAAWLVSGTGTPTTFYGDDNVSYNSAATVAVPGAVTSGSMVIGNAAGTVGLTGAGAITASALSKSGAGAATIANAVTLAGGLTISGGTLSTSGLVTVSAGGVNVGGGSLTANGGLVVNAGGITVNPGAAATLAASGTVTGGLSVAGGSLTINAAQAVSGDTTVSGGGVLALNSGTLGSGTVTLNNGTLTPGSAVASLSNPVAIGAGGGTISNADPFTLSGAISGSSRVLTKTGAGMLTLSGAIGSTKNGVTISFTSGSIAFAGNVTRILATSTFNGSAALQGGTLRLLDELTGSGTLATSGNTTFSTSSNDGGGSRTISLPLRLDGAVSLQSSVDRAITVTGALAGSGTVTTSGNARVSLRSSTSSFTGSLVVGHATQANGVTEASTQALGNAASVVVNANTSRVGGTNLEIINSTSGTFGGTISGVGVVGVLGSGKATFSGTNIYGGGTLLQTSVGVTNSSALGTGTVTAIASTATVFWDGDGSSVTLGNNLSTGTSASYVLTFTPGSGDTIALTGTVSGLGQLKVGGGGDLDISQLGGNGSTGGIEIGTGRIFTNGANLGGGAINFGTVANSHVVATANATISNPFTIGASGAVGYAANFDTNGRTVVISGTISDRVGNASGGRLVKLGAGSLTLSASNGYTGSTTVSEGTLAAGHVRAFGSGTVTVGGGTLDLGSLAVGNALVLQSGGLANAANYVGTQTVTGTFSYASGSVGGTVNAVAGGILKGSGVTFTGPVTIGNGAVHAPGNSPGTQTFTAGLSYTGSSALQWELIASTTTSPGTSYDSISLTGGSLAITSGAALQLLFSGSGSTVDWNDTFWNTNHTWTVIDVGNGLSSSGIFTLVGDGSTWLDANSTSLASAMGPNQRTVSDFVLDNSTGSILLNYTVAVVPEPSTLALMGLGAAGWAAFRRGRRRPS